MLPSSALQSSSQGQPRRYRRRTVPQERPKRTEITACCREHSAKEVPPSAKRKRPPASTVTRVEPLSIPLQFDKLWIVQTATSVLVDHLLFTRGLFPVTVSELLAQSNEEGHSYARGASSSSSTRRKLRQARNQLEQFTQAWTSNNSSAFIRRASYVLITLGPSFGRGRESYLVDLRGLLWKSTRRHLKPLPPSIVLARRLLPRVMESDGGAKLPASAASLRLFVSLWLPKDELEEYWKEVSGDSPNSRTFDTTSSTNWIPRVGRVLPKAEELYSTSNTMRPKKRLVAITLKHQTEVGTLEAAENESDEDILDLSGTEGNGQWFTLPQVVKGFRM
jgi:hypothetical protein